MLRLPVGLTILFSVFGPGVGEAVVLEYQGSPNQVFTYRFTCAADGELRVGGKTEPVTSQGAVTVVETIVAVSEKKHLKVRFTFPKGHLSSSLGRGVVSVPLVFPPVELTLTPTGNPLAARLVPESSPEAGESAADFADLFTHLRCLSFPPGEVQPGDSWSVTGTLSRPGGTSVQVTGVSRLTGVEEHGGVRCAVIHARVTIPLDSTQKILGLTAKVTGKSIVTSTTYFDLAAGRVRELLGTERAMRTIHLNASGNEAPGNRDSPATIRLDSTTSFTLTLQGVSP